MQKLLLAKTIASSVALEYLSDERWVVLRTESASPALRKGAFISK
jgi:hypothetical protein